MYLTQVYATGIANVPKMLLEMVLTAGYQAELPPPRPHTSIPRIRIFLPSLEVLETQCMVFPI